MGLTVNGERIDEASIGREAETMRPEYERQFTEMDPQEREAQLQEWASENVVERAVLQQEAQRQGIPVDEAQVKKTFAQLKEESDDIGTLCERMACRSEEELLARLRTSTQTEALLAQVQKRAPAPSKQAIRKVYEENKADFQTPERVNCAHIVKHINGKTTEQLALAAITDAKQQLEQGVQFETLVERVSDDAENGGSLGYISRGQMVEEFDDIVFNLGTGEVSDVFRTRFGYHIATIYDRQAAQLQPFEAVREQIEQRLQEEINSDALYAFIDELKAKASIEKTSDAD